ncbi:hypothetical protein WJX84_002707 [Apatococcus fuscideae]|uniref:Uncharacterized protein n=1 Tax=Apatococcus fuscideae TaxID=2026836 RepID=A0AAW1T6Y7_9CHLO
MRGFSPLALQPLQDMTARREWDVVVPAHGGIRSVFCALDIELLDLPINISVPTYGPMARLRDLQSIPKVARGKIMGDLAARIVNADRFSHEGDHSVALRSQHLVGEAALLTLVFSRTSNLSEVLDTNLTPAGPTRPAAPFPEFSNQKEAWLLSRDQVRLAKVVWRDMGRALEALQREEHQIQCELGCTSSSEVFERQQWASMQAQPQPRLLELAARLQSNLRRQQHVLGRGRFITLFEICSPSSVQKMICSFWPRFPDILAFLKHLAEAL